MKIVDCNNMNEKCICNLDKCTCGYTKGKCGDMVCKNYASMEERSADVEDNSSFRIGKKIPENFAKEGKNMFRVMIKNIFFNSWILTDEKFETLDKAKIEVEKRINGGEGLNNLKIIKECEDVKIRVI